ncbi:MAG: hypothetical protein CMD15_01410 [Flavobacteriales bacterium]|nr:hypothetical protein [Flavobacteriales bacterium]|tara:strand:+ start:16733 stop:17575 length:843 start_codon:yes stop_codon:yes gene_type:complete
MISLTLTILFTVSLFIFFKEFEKRNINTHQAITFNYLTASIIAILLYGNPICLTDIVNTSWIYPTIALGIFFVVMFNIMAKTTQQLGISIASIASKMSLVIPVIAALLFQRNINLSIYNYIGILLALIAIFLTFKKKQKTQKSLKIAVFLFFGAGILDSFLDYIREKHLESINDFNLFIILIFFIAFFTGFVIIIFNRNKISFKNIIGGVLLGIPNYFSIYFVLLSLESLGGAVVFPVLNIGVVLISTIISYLVYKENLNKENWFGIVLACVSIFLLLSF